MELPPRRISSGWLLYKSAKSACHIGNVLSCIKSKNLYTAYVQGSNFDLEYEVHIKVDNDNVIQKMDCTCPCTTLCKHEYATILYLRNKKNRKEKGPIM